MTDLRCDIAVIGAGPAGLQAALTAAEKGCLVALVDAGPQMGGQFWRHPDEKGDLGDEGWGQHRWKRFVAMRERLEAYERQRGAGPGRVIRIPGQEVWFVERGFRDDFVLHVRPTFTDTRASTGPQGLPDRVLAGRVIICTGAYDRQLPVPGWDLPGVMAAGGAQALVKAQRVSPGRRVVVAGTGPFLLSVASTLAHAGAHVVAVCDSSSPSAWLRSPGGVLSAPSKAGEAVAHATTFLRYRIPMRFRTVVTAARGRESLESVRLGRVDSSGRLRVDGNADEITADLLAMGWGFTPSLELPAALGVGTRLDIDGSLVAAVDGWQRTDVKGVLAAGEITGVGGSALALAEGELAAVAACQELGIVQATGRARQLQRMIRRGRRFARAMHLAHPVPEGWRDWLEPDTTVCRCEEVSMGEIASSRAELGATNARTVKLTTRAGMGWCQGRVCGFAVARLACAEAGSPTETELSALAKRPFAFPVTLAELAGAHEETTYDDAT